MRSRIMLWSAISSFFFFLLFFPSSVISQEVPSKDCVSPNIGVLRYVPAGRFQRDDKVQNISVISSSYRMSQHEITRSQFKTIMGIDPGDPRVSSGTSDPVQMVNWYHAIAFCNKLSLIEGLTPVYKVSGVDFTTLTYGKIPLANNADWNAVEADWSANGYRLPTVMEWMWAAMGALPDEQSGSINTSGYAKEFSGSSISNKISDYVWDYLTSDLKSAPVGTKLANELGLYDLSGNISEWCWDRDGMYPSGTLYDYRGADSGKDRIVAGGSWSNTSFECAINSRFPVGPDVRDFLIGFRVIRP